MHYLYAPQTPGPETSLFDDVKQRPDRRRRHSRSSLSTRVASTSTSPSRRLPAADDDEFSYALASALASAMTIAKAETILEESFSNAFELPPPKRPARASARTNTSDAPSPAFVQVAAAPPAEDNATDEWQAEYEAHLRTWKAQSAQARERAEKERKRWEAIRAAERARGGRPREPSHTRAVAYPPASGVPSPSPADARDLVRGEPQKR
uniref:Expressed protein n=2 Tax=Schizophyllum commune (strain H4-8 / FGSC 9210) TaxID=578458 RepID=D8Q9D2_SCHCM